MFQYERVFLKKAFQRTSAVVRAVWTRAWRAVAKFSEFVNRQVTDPAVRRALVLGSAAFMVRHLPFLDQSAAENLSTEALVATGILLSKMKGTEELRQKARKDPVTPPEVLS